MARANEVARYLVHLAYNDEEPDFLTHLRLQKLLYYVQAWSMVQHGRALFPERIEAWAHGPVVPDVWSNFAKHGRRPILPEDVGDPEFDLDDDEMRFIGSVWETYRAFSPSQLRAMIHDEPPWADARGDLGPTDGCSNVISVGAMQDYFSSAPTE